MVRKDRHPAWQRQLIRLSGAAAVAWSCLGSASTDAAVLTCATFKIRFDESLRALKASPAETPSFGAITTLSGGRQIAWTEAGLSGRLTCGEQDALADFYMVLDPAAPRRDGVPSDLTAFKDLAAASICALTAGSDEACRAMTTSMIDEAAQNYHDDLAQKDDRPAGLRYYDFAPGLSAVLYLTPVALSWAVGPGLFDPVEDARPDLKPTARDDDD